MDRQPVVGIDLGTTNSAVAVLGDDGPVLLPVDGADLLPSVVGVAPDGEVLVGRAARNQALLYPERTIASVKRRMGTEEPLEIGGRTWRPAEVAALILRKLALAASEALGQPVRKAVITVPAYFDDAQRNATRAAGEIAGLQVLRIIHEPTAAALCYGVDPGDTRTQMVYDLGGGTFDVSIVRTGGELTEVLASHGDTALGGDDFDALLAETLRHAFEDDTGLDIRGNLRASARLRRAAEDAKIALSVESYHRVLEEHLAEKDGVQRHLDEEITRHAFEELIAPLLDRTLDAVQVTLRDAGLLARDLDDLILVGGSTATPKVAAMLSELLGLPPRMDIDPERAVALGAAIAAARLDGRAVERILVDVTPHSLGVQCRGEVRGRRTDHRFAPIVRRNSRLPLRRTEVFYTVAPGQRQVEVKVLRGEEEDARDNELLGKFSVEGLDEDAASGSPIHFCFELDLDGILNVTVTEKHSGLNKAVTIEDAFRPLGDGDIESAREALLRDLPGLPAPVPVEDAAPGDKPPPGLKPTEHEAWRQATEAMREARTLRRRVDPADAEELQELIDLVSAALQAGDLRAAGDATSELSDVIFYLQ